MGKLPLEGIRIVDLTKVYAGPYASLLLASMGAEVIKIEPSTSADTVRGTGLSLGVPDNKPTGNFWNQSANFNATNRSKKALALDLRGDRGKELLKELVKTSDVVMENFTPRVMRNFGLEYEVLAAINPRIVMLSSCGYGATGPYSNYRAMGMSMEGAIGLINITGYEDVPPIRATVAYTDFQAGRWGAIALLMALQNRRRTGKGQHVDLAQYECGAWWVGPALMDYSMNGRVQGRMGNRHPYRVPQGCYRCTGDDKWVTISVGTDEEWVALCETMGQPSLAQDQRFADPINRRKHHDELDGFINEWTSQHDQYEVMHLLQGRGVASGPVLTNKGVLTDPHLKDRGFWEMVTSPEEATNVGTRVYPKMPWISKKSPTPPSTPAPTMGQHNQEVLTGILGLSAEEVVALEADGTISTSLADVPIPVNPPVETLIERGMIQEYDPDFMEVLGLK